MTTVAKDTDTKLLNEYLQLIKENQITLEKVPGRFILKIAGDKSKYSDIHAQVLEHFQKLVKNKKDINDSRSNGQREGEVVNKLSLDEIQQMIDINNITNDMGKPSLGLDNKMMQDLQRARNQKLVEKATLNDNSGTFDIYIPPNDPTDPEPYGWGGPFTGFVNTFAVISRSCAERKKMQDKLRFAAKDGDVKEINSLLAAGVNIDGRGLTDSFCAVYQNFFDKTALMIAVINNKMNTVTYLIDNKASLSLKDRYGYNAMDYAVYKDLPKMAQLLYQKGADVSEVDSYVTKEKRDQCLARAPQTTDAAVALATTRPTLG